MLPKDDADRRRRFGVEFDAHENGSSGLQVSNGLCYGLTTLRNLLFTRVHEDVEKHVGRDSLVMPLSPAKSEAQTKLEIETYQVAVSTAEVQQRGYVRDHVWYAAWLGRLRLGDLATDEARRRRVARYLELSPEERRLGFSRVLEKTFPEATSAPLVLYRLLPLAVGIATALAFGDSAAAAELRERQKTWLPSIGDCHECRGRLLDNGERCETCSNPLWNYASLNASN